MGEEAVLNFLSDTKSPWGFILSLLIILAMVSGLFSKAAAEYGGLIGTAARAIQRHKQDAIAADEAEIYGKARLYDNARAIDHTHVCESAILDKNALAANKARVGGQVRMTDNARAVEEARLDGEVRLSDNACACGNSWLSGKVRLKGASEVRDILEVYKG